MVKYLLTEGNNFNENVEPLQESVDGKKFWYLEGIFADSNPNRNGRVYAESLWVREIEKYNSEKIKNRCSFGEMNHPSTNAHEINPDNVCMLMTEARTEKGGNVYGKARILETPKGQIGIGILEGGGRLSASSRGLGTIGEQVEISGKKYGRVDEKTFSLVGWDAVLFPSNFACDNLKGITESVISRAYEIRSGGVILERALNEFERALAANGTRNLKKDLKSFLKTALV